MANKKRGSLCIAYEDLELVGGNWNAAALLSWFRRCQHKHPNGFQVTQATITDRLMLERRTFERARELLCTLGLLEITREGFPAKLTYNLTETALNSGAKNDSKDSLYNSQDVQSVQPRDEKPVTTSDTAQITPLQDVQNIQTQEATGCRNAYNQYLIYSDIEKRKNVRFESEAPLLSANADATFSKDSGKKKPSVPRKQLEQLIDTYNANRAQLPKASLTPPRVNKLTTLVKQRGFEDVLDLIGKGSQEIAQDAFWVQNRYGLDNLLRDSHLDAKAAAWESRLNNAKPQPREWWKVTIIDEKGKAHQHSAYVRVVKDDMIECSVLLREDFSTYDEGQRNTRRMDISENAFILRYGAEPACVQRVRADKERILAQKAEAQNAIA